MAAVAIRHRFQQHRPVARAQAHDRLLRRLEHGGHVHPVDPAARNAEGRAPLMELGHRRRALHRRAHGVLVVLDHEEHRKLPERRHVEGLEDLALVGRAVAEIGDGNPVGGPVLVGEAEADAERHLGADDAVAAVEAALRREQVHRAALALGCAGRAPGELGHDVAGGHTRDQHVGVAAIAGDDRIARPERVLHAGDHRLLPDVEVAEAADHPHAVELAGLLLEAAEQQHVAERALQRLRLHRGCLRGRSSPAPGPFPGARHCVLAPDARATLIALGGTEPWGTLGQTRRPDKGRPVLLAMASG